MRSSLISDLLVVLVTLTVARVSNAQDITSLGGDLSSNFPGRHAIQLPAPNVSDETRRNEMLAGFTVFHRKTSEAQGLGPFFVNDSCGGCHVENGKGPARFSKTFGDFSALVLQISLKGLNPDGSIREVPGYGRVIQDNSISSRRKFDLSLKWDYIEGRYPDGTKYKLRKPRVGFKLPGVNTRKILQSLRMSPLLVGQGLLEAVPDSTIIALSDPFDLNNDGISGRANYVIDQTTGQLRVGKFGFKATQPTLAQQTAAAFFNEMGVANQIFNTPTQPSEISDDDFSKLMFYQKLAGVPFATKQNDPKVMAGKIHFQTIGCDSCHVMTLQTGQTEDPELSNQTIHPFTDLLLHDMGKELADRRPEFSASGTEWRTTPLWGLGFASTVSRIRPLFMHDGRARTIEEAILWHGGEGASSKKKFMELPKAKRKELLEFLKSL